MLCGKIVQVDAVQEAICVNGQKNFLLNIVGIQGRCAEETAKGRLVLHMRFIRIMLS